MTNVIRLERGSEKEAEPWKSAEEKLSNKAKGEGVCALLRNIPSIKAWSVQVQTCTRSSTTPLIFF